MILEPRYNHNDAKTKDNQYDSNKSSITILDKLGNRFNSKNRNRVAEFSTQNNIKNQQDNIYQKTQRSRFAISILDMTNIADQANDAKYEKKYREKNNRTEASVDHTKPSNDLIQLFQNDVLKKNLKIKEHQPNIVNVPHFIRKDRAKSDKKVIVEERRRPSPQWMRWKLFSPLPNDKVQKAPESDKTSIYSLKYSEKLNNNRRNKLKAIERNFIQSSDIKLKPSVKILEKFEKRASEENENFETILTRNQGFQGKKLTINYPANDFIRKAQSDFYHNHKTLKIKFLEVVENLISFPLKENQSIKENLLE